MQDMHGAKARCKHVAALCYALDDFSKLQSLLDFQSVTERLQTWNQPRPKSSIYYLLLIYEQERKNYCHQQNTFLTTADHSLIHALQKYRKINRENIETLKCELLQLHAPCRMTQLLIPPIEKVHHDHNYCTSIDTQSQAVVSPPVDNNIIM